MKPRLISAMILFCMMQTNFACGYELDNGRSLDYYMQYLNYGENLTRIEAITHIGELADSRGTDAVILSLRSDGDWRVRSTAARTLGRINDTNAVEPLIQTLSEDKNDYVRSDAAWALGVLRSSKAVGPLTEALNDKDPKVRSSAAYALGELGAGKESLLRSLHDENSTVRLAANWSLERLNMSAS